MMAYPKKGERDLAYLFSIHFYIPLYNIQEMTREL